MAKNSKRAIPLAAMERLLKRSHARRVSDSAKEALRDLVEDFAEKISLKAVKVAEHAGRKTVQGKDIKLASQ